MNENALHRKRLRIVTIVIANVAVGILTFSSCVYRGFQGYMANQRLSTAAERGDIPGMEAVLAQGYSVDVDSGETDTTALLSAAEAGRLNSVNFLLTHGADVNHQDYYRGWTALYSTDSAEVAKTLLAHEASPEVLDKMRDSTPLLQWAATGNQQVVLLLLKHGANPTFKRSDGKTPAEVASASGHAGVAKTLRAAEIAWQKKHPR